MTKNNIISLEWEKCCKGYELIPNPIRQSKERLPKDQQYLFNNPDLYSGHVIFPLGIAKNNYEVLGKEKGVMVKRFLQLIPEGQDIINNDRLRKFVNEYGLLGITPNGNFEDVYMWEYHVREFKKIESIFQTRESDQIALGKSMTLYLTLPMANNFKAMMNWDPNRLNRSLYFKPANLLAAIWLAFGDIFTKGLDIDQCQRADCDEYFKRRSNKKFCSDKCRVYTNNSNK